MGRPRRGALARAFGRRTPRPYRSRRMAPPPQFFTLEKVAPRFISSSSTRKGTTFVGPTASSLPLVKPVTVLPSTKSLPDGVLT
jgi:hypothetical protein